MPYFEMKVELEVVTCSPCSPAGSRRTGNSRRAAQGFAPSLNFELLASHTQLKLDHNHSGKFAIKGTVIPVEVCLLRGQYLQLRLSNLC